MLISRVDESSIELTLTAIVAYGSFLAAEHFHVSGVIATVTAGLVVGSYGVPKGMSSRSRVALFGFWDYFAFIINSLVFLLIGVSVHITDLVAASVSILIATCAVILGRFLTIYGLAPLANRISPRAPSSWNHVLFWGGLHGSVSMALALGLPQDLPGRAQILSMTFGVVAFSIIIQGLTMRPLVAWLGLKATDRDAYDRLKAEQLAVSAAALELRTLRERSLVSATIFEELSQEISGRSSRVETSIRLAQAEIPVYADEERRIARHHLAMSERIAMREALSEGILSEESVQDCLKDIYERLDPGKQG